MSIRQRGLIREIARLGVLFSIAYLALSLILLALGYEHRHAYVMLYSSLLLFPHSVAIVYVASGAVSEGRALKLTLTASLLTVAMFVTPLLGLWLNWLVPTATFLVISIIMAPAALTGGLRKRGSIRLSLIMVASSYVAFIATAISLLLRGWPSKFSVAATALTFSYPVTLIYSVTVHSLPSTFKDSPSYLTAWLLPFLSAGGAVLVAIRALRAGVAVVALSTMLYIYASRMYRLRTYLRSLEGLDKRSAAYRGSAFFINGHYAVIGSVLLVLVFSVLYLKGFCSLLCLLHSYVMGFVSVHVFIHAPMMLPVVLKVRHKRRYMILPLVLALIAAAAWPVSGVASYILYVIAFCLDVRIVTC